MTSRSEAIRFALGALLLGAFALLGLREQLRGAPEFFSWTLGSVQTRYAIDTRVGTEPMAGVQFAVRYGYGQESTTTRPVERLLGTVRTLESQPEHAGRTESHIVFRRNLGETQKWDHGTPRAKEEGKP